MIGINVIEIPFVMWGTNKVGVALYKMVDGENEIRVTLKNKSGELIYPNPILINKEEVVAKYGVSVINKKNLLGVWIPLPKRL